MPIRIMLSEVNTSLLQLVKRAEHNDPAILERTFVDTGALSALLRSPSNQLVYGRRGTGKTHALLYAKASLPDTDIGVYKDLRCTGSNGSIYSDQDRPITERATRLILDVLADVHDGLVSAALGRNSDTEALRLLDLLADEIRTVRVEGDVEVERSDAFRRSEDTKASIKLALATDKAAASYSGGDSSATELGRNDKYVIRGKAAPRVIFGTIAKLLSRIIESMQCQRVWLFMDEWAVIPNELQPFLADMLRRCILPVNKMFVKIAAIEQRSLFKLALKNGDYIGFELGADIGADIDLDDFMVFNNSKSNARAFFARLIYNHVHAAAVDIAGNNEDMERKTRIFIASAFSQDPAFDELVRACEGVPRDAIHILGICAQKAGNGKITIPVVREAAKVWYQRDKESPIPPDGKAALVWIVENVIRKKRARAFLLERDFCNDALIENLVDLRVLHVLKRGISSKDQPGKRYVAFAVDYGCYVDLLATKDAPEYLFCVDDDVPVEVPGEDYRSIRHAVLDLVEYRQRIGWHASRN